MSPELQEPIDVHDAEWRATVLAEEIERIEAQLADERPRRNKVTNETLTDDEYRIWRKRAEDALYHKKAEASYLDAWMKRFSSETKGIYEALGEAVPIIVRNLPPNDYPAIQKLLKAAGMYTGTYNA